jgi:hypothetical protein
MSDENDIENVFGGSLEKPAPSTARPGPEVKKSAPRKPAPAKTDVPKVEYIRVKLAHSKEIPPGGLYLGHNGKGYLLKPGVEADVPDFLLDVLDNAVMAKPVTGPNGQIESWEDQPRFMYSIIRKK